MEITEDVTQLLESKARLIDTIDEGLLRPDIFPEDKAAIELKDAYYELVNLVDQFYRQKFAENPENLLALLEDAKKAWKRFEEAVRGFVSIEKEINEKILPITEMHNRSK